MKPNPHFYLDIDPSWTLFLDRDGVINVRPMHDYVKSWEEFQFLPGCLEAIYLLTPLFYKIVVVTNQQGIGKGVMTDRGLAHIHDQMLASIEQAHGQIDAIYYAPQLAWEDSPYRKPNPGMAHQARAEFPYIEYSKSVMVGDTESDFQFAQNTGMYFVWCNEEAPPRHIREYIDLHVPNLLGFARLVSK